MSTQRNMGWDPTSLQRCGLHNVIYYVLFPWDCCKNTENLTDLLIAEIPILPGTRAFLILSTYFLIVTLWCVNSVLTRPDLPFFLAFLAKTLLPFPTIPLAFSYILNFGK